VKLTVHWCLSLINHAHLQGMQTFASDHAIINDESHDSALLHYYIAPEAQRRQLAEQGFELLDIFDDMGVPVSAGSRAENSHWLLYVARRLPVS
jgi:hypothetical protein